MFGKKKVELNGLLSALLNKWKETLHGVMYIQIQQLYVIEFLSSLYLVDFLWSENLMKYWLDFTYSTKKLKLPHMTTFIFGYLFLYKELPEGTSTFVL